MITGPKFQDYINPSSLRAFFFSLVFILIFTALQSTGVVYYVGEKLKDLVGINNDASVQIKSPGFSVSASDYFDQVKPKLETEEINFKLGNNGVLAGSSTLEAENAHAYLAVDLKNGQILFEKNSSTPLPVASITKIMSAIVALDLADLNEVFKVSSNAAQQIPTKIGVVPGQALTCQELLNAALLTSANDAIQVLKEGIDQKYKEGTFIKAMNYKAQVLGLKNTSFDNPQGFDGPANFSSAQDLAVLSNYALNNYPKFAEIVAKNYKFLPASPSHKQFDLYNWNGLLGVYPGVYGIKIGNTDDAGKTTVVVSKREGQKVLVVLLGAPGVLERDLWAAQILDAAFGQLSVQPVGVTEDQLMAKYASWQYWR